MTLNTRVTALEGAVSNLTAGQAEILSILRGTSTAPEAPKGKKGGKGGKKAPEVVVTGEKVCVGCGKDMLRVGALCRKCRIGGTTEVKTSTGTSRRLNSVQKAPEGGFVVVIAGDAKAKGRTAADHCAAEGCHLFTKATETYCGTHKAAQKAPEAFLTLEDGSKYGYRVPADLVLSLRKARLSDEVIVKAAKAQGLGKKASKTVGAL